MTTEAKGVGLLNYVTDGHGPPVILVHGIAASLADWSRLMPLLVSAGYQAIAVDLLGHGDSPKPKNPGLYTAEGAYTALEDLIDHLALETPFYLIGHSLGGYMSLTYALNHPDRVQAMVLLNPLYSLEQLTRMLDLLMPLASVGIGLLQATPQWLVNSFLSYNDSFLTKLDQETRWAYARDIKRAAPNFLRIPINAPDLTPKLRAVEPATLVLWGIDDRIEKAESFQELVSGLPNATGKGIPNCGHHPHQAEPELVSRMILDFFKQHPVTDAEAAAPVEAAMQIEPAEMAAQIEEFLRASVDEFQRDGVVVGMSGGLDSSVVANLAARALGPDKVLALLLPERDSSPDSKADALLEIERLGIEHREISLTPMLSAMGIYGLTPLRLLGARSVKAAIVQHQHRAQAAELGEMPFRAGLLGTRDLGDHKKLIDTGNAYARVKHRMRMVALYYHADLENRLVLGTTNRSEAMVGFVVKWGDNVADVELLLPLYKTQVQQLARYLGVSDKIINKAPSPDLIPGIVDGLALGMDYETLDRILWGLEQGWTDEAIVRNLGVTAAQVENVQEMWRRSEHTRTLPPSPDLVIGSESEPVTRPESRRPEAQAGAREAAGPIGDGIPDRVQPAARASVTPTTRDAGPSKQTARQLLQEMPQLFRPERARRVRAVIQFHLSGEGGGDWVVSVHDGTCIVGEGAAQNPNATITMTADDYVALANRQLNGPRAFMTGRIKAKGDISLLRKMESWFPR